MQYSVVNYSKLERTTRLDGEFYKPIFLEILELLQKVRTKPMTDLCKVSDGNHMSIANYFQENEGVPYYRGQDINTDFFLENANPVYISDEIYNRGYMKRSYFKNGDVLLSIVGTVGSLSLITDNIKKATGSCKLAILRPSKISPEFLSTFLMCRYGNFQIKRNTRGAVQMGLLLEDMDQIQVFIPSNEFEKKVKRLIEKSILLNRNSKSFYSHAEQLLLSELGLLDWKPKHELVFVKNFSKTKQSDRCDAEYFQPKYEEIVEAVKEYKNGFDELENLVKIKDKNFTPKESEQYKYIELANISSNGEINGYTENFGNELPSRARRKVQKGDLIVSTIEGSLDSIALVTEDWENALCSTGFFAINSDKVNPETLLVLLKTKVGQLQLKKGCKGTILTAISKDELSKIVLPKIDSKTQEQIKEKIVEMYQSKKLSKSLLEIAKRGVEMAIEKDEQEAEKWIKVELNKLDTLY